MASSAGLNGNYSNHSLHATSASRLYNANVNEQLISEVTGHHLNAVRGYNRTSNDQLKSVSNILYGGEFKPCDKLNQQVCKKNVMKSEHDECKPEAKKHKVDLDVVSKSETCPVSVNVTVNFNK